MCATIFVHDGAVLMARPHSIAVPKRAPVRFPDRCPVCGKAEPGHRAKLDQLFGPLAPTSPDVLARWQPDLPICEAHVRRVRNGRLSDRLSMVGFALAGLAALFYLAGRYEPFSAGFWSWLGVVVAGFLPLGVMRWLMRPIFDVWSDDELLEFQLRNRDYARDFEALNSQ